MKNQNKGFSLVELIIVIAIMAILVGVMAPQLLKYIEKAKTSSDIQTLDTIAAAYQTAIGDPDVVMASSVSVATHVKTIPTTITAQTDPLDSAAFENIGLNKTVSFKSTAAGTGTPQAEVSITSNSSVVVTVGSLSVVR